MTTYEDRYRRIRGVGPYPSGPKIFDAFLPEFLRGVRRRTDPESASIAETMEAQIARWLSFDAPLWWVDMDTEADILNTALPDAICPADIDWPFPVFGFVTRDTMILSGVDECDRRLNVNTGEIEPAFVMMTSTPSRDHSTFYTCSVRDAFSHVGTKRIESVGEGALTDSERLKLQHLCFGGALLLSTHSGEEAKRVILPPPPLGKNPTRKQRASGMIDPPWLCDAAERASRSVGWGEGTSPAAHWRRAHYRLARVGKGRADRRTVLVTHCEVNGLKSRALRATKSDSIQTAKSA